MSLPSSRSVAADAATLNGVAYATEATFVASGPFVP
jgi:hypothetical protein